MITNWIITGDTHGQNEIRLGNIVRNLPKGQKPEETAVIILGDAGYNFYLNKTDKKHKHNTYGVHVYCVRGNHEERPENLGYETIYDENVTGSVYIDPVNNKIRYFKDGGTYIIDNKTVLVLGGAYSIDKWYRLSNASDKPGAWTGWFKDEQLTPEEMNKISEMVNGLRFDLVFSHTCPLAWEPTDLFLRGVDQSQVDKSMEIWLNQIKDTFEWKVWLFGHYHADRIERPGVEQFFRDHENLNDIWTRWTTDKELDWWLVKSPNYYMGQ